MRVLQVMALVAGIVFLSACDRGGSTDESIAQVNKLLELRAQAIESKDLELYKRIVFKEYSENGVFYEDIIQDVERIFSKPGKIEYTYQKARPSITMNSARVVHMIEYKFLDSGESAKAHEKLYLRKIDGEWLISGGVILGLAL